MSLRPRSRSHSRTRSPVSSTPVAPTFGPLLQRVAERLHVTEVEAADIAPELLRELAASMGLDVAERCLLDVEVQRARGTKQRPDSEVAALTRHFTAQELRDLEPWRKRHEQLRQRRDQWIAMPLAELQQRFLALAKDNQLSPPEVLLGFTALYATDADRRLIGGLLCCETDSDRVPEFNLALAERKGDTFLAQYGAALCQLQFPLFPPTEAFDILNQRLLREVGGVTGAGTARPTVFRRTRGEDDILGGAALPVQQRPDGTGWEVDVTVVERSFQDVFDNIRQLSARVDNAVKDRSEKQLGALASAVTELRHTVIAAQRSVFPTQRAQPRRQQQQQQQQPKRQQRRGPRGGEAEATSTPDF